jgi:hypothetical protein
MWKIIIGFATGVYIGTYYDCKPILEKIKEHCNETMPKSKD